MRRGYSFLKPDLSHAANTRATRSAAATALGAAMLVLATLFCPLRASSEVDLPPPRQSCEVLSLQPPAVVRSTDGTQAVYELHLTNFSRRPLRIASLRIEAPGSRQPLATFTGETLGQRLRLIATDRSQGDSGALPTGARAVLYLEVPLGEKPIPRALQHDFGFREGRDETEAPGSSVSVSIPLDTSPPLELGPPLRGGPWVAVYDPAMDAGHRRVVYAVAGHARVPGRFAIDWFKLGENGGVAQGDGAKTADYFGYGADVLAVADATVAATRDNFPEPRTIADAPSVPIADATGNYIALDLGNGRTAFYEHLQPGLKVKPGQRVRRGQAIARVGFTGQTTAPHLHFHVANRNSPLDAESLPYLLSGFVSIGRFETLAAVFEDKARVPMAKEGAAGTAAAPAFPAPNLAVRFQD
ncbi:hypothetical protein DB347_19375 [Opitutaceae bacterium EW11]|nr:hypothetical protein DB347_19375 [Opitutaceae bacterium EW11]